MAVPLSIYSERLEDRNIRLLQLLPDDGNDEEFQCSLVYRSLDNPSSYNALSYVWGNPSETKRIICNGSPCDVTSNLYQALRHVRRRYGSCLLWADALCINQADLDERTHQVRMMEHIYQRADLVVIWLGEEELGDREAYMLAYELRRLIGDTVTDFQGVNAFINRGIDDASDPALQALLSKEKEWNDLDRMLMRPWFSRAWIIQELLMAKSTVTLTGDYAMEINVLLNFGSLIVIHPAISIRAFSIPRATTLGHNHYSPVTALRGLVATRLLMSNLILSDVLGMTTEVKATDPRDRIFALIGLSEDIPRSFIDYTRSRQDVVIDLATQLIRQTSFPILKICYAPVMKPSSGIPSWATDWTSTSTGLEAVSMMVPFDYSSTYGVPSLRFESERILAIHGKIIDQIEEMIPSYPFFQSREEAGADTDFEYTVESCIRANKWVKEVFEVCRRNYKPSTGLSFEEAIWRAVTCNGAPLRYPAPAEYSKAFDAWLEWIEALPAWVNEMEQYYERDEDPPEELRERGRVIEQLPLKVRPMQQTFDRVADARLFCVTKRGYFGWVPKTSKAGDEVVTFIGGHVPFITSLINKPVDTTQLRSTGDKDRLLRALLGDCYLHGLVMLTPNELQEFKTEEILLE